MKKLISLLLTVGLMSTLFVACTAEEETAVSRDTVDYSKYILSPFDEIITDLGYTEDEIVYPNAETTQKTIAELPGTETILGYDATVVMYLEMGTYECYAYAYRIDFTDDLDGAISTMDDLIVKLEELYGEKDTSINSPYVYSSRDDASSSITSGTDTSMVEIWTVADYGYEDAEQVLNDYAVEMGYTGYYFTFTAQAEIESFDRGANTSVYVSYQGDFTTYN